MATRARRTARAWSSPAWARSRRRAPTPTPLGRRARRPASRSARSSTSRWRATAPASAARCRTTSRPRATTASPTASASRAIDFALQAAEEAHDAAAASARAGAARALGRGDRHLQRRPAERARSGTRRAWRARRPIRELLLLVPPQAIAEALSGGVRAQGPGAVVDTACAAGANAIGYAAELIRRGQRGRRADRRRRRASRTCCSPASTPSSRCRRSRPRRTRRDRQGLSLGEGSGMLVLVREDLAREPGAPILAEVAGLRPVGRRLPPDRAASRGQGRGAGDQGGAARRPGVEPEAGRLRQQPRHGHAEERPGRDARRPSSASARPPRHGRGEQHQVDDRPPARRRRRGRGDRHRQGAGGADRAAHRQLHGARPRVRPRLRAERARGRMAIDVAVSNNFAFGGANASLVFARAGRARRAPAARRTSTAS